MPSLPSWLYSQGFCKIDLENGIKVDLHELGFWKVFFFSFPNPIETILKLYYKLFFFSQIMYLYISSSFRPTRIVGHLLLIL